MKFKYVLFDLDGTLLDTNRLIIDSFRHTFRAHLGLELSDEEIVKHFGEPLIVTMKRYSEDKYEEMFRTYKEYNDYHHDSSISLCDGVVECLEWLKSEGCKIALVTSKFRPIAIRGMDIFSIRKYFDAIVTFEDTTEHKPEAAPILAALELLGAPKEESIMVGDSVFDILCAKNAGVKSVLVKWSAADGFQENAVEADYQVHHLKDLIDIVK